MFNCYRNWAQLLLRQPGEPPVTIMRQEGVTHGYPFSMILYGITLSPLTEELRAADPGILSPCTMRNLTVRNDKVYRS